MTQIRHSYPVDTKLLRTNPKYMFNPCVDALAPAASIQLAEKAKTLAAAGQTIFDLTIGEPDFDTPASIKEAAIRAIARNNTHYVNGRGILPLRERIAAKLHEENGIACAPENVLVTPGAKSAIYVAVRTLIGAGDEAIVLDPSWVSYASIIQASGGIVRSVELPYDDGHRITLTKLEAARSDRCRLLIVNSPNNPTGRMLNSGEAQAIAEFASRHKLYVVADEIYEKIAFDGRLHISLGAIPEIADRVITVNGLSKSAAMTGWRVGYLCADAELVDKMYMLYQHMLTCISGFTQEAAVVAFDCTGEIEAMRAAYEGRRNLFVESLQNVPGVVCRVPEGTFYSWAYFDHPTMTSAQICDFLLEEARVASVPGEAYGLGGAHCVRFSLATSEDLLQEAAERIGVAVKKVMARETPILAIPGHGSEKSFRRSAPYPHRRNLSDLSRSKVENIGLVTDEDTIRRRDQE